MSVWTPGLMHERFTWQCTDHACAPGGRFEEDFKDVTNQPTALWLSVECNRSFRGWLQKIFFEESGYVPIKSDSFWVSSLPAWSHYSNFLWKSLILNGVGFLIVIIFCWHLNWIQSVGRFMCSHHRVSSSVTLLTTQIRSSPCCMKD